jgi:DNA-binding XRE family transcriptional regulator
MGEPKFIETPSGDEIVILLRADYDALVAAAADAEEDASDIALYDQRKADIAANPDDVLPAPVSDALTRGDGLLKALRQWRGMTRSALADSAGLSEAALDALEVGREAAAPGVLKSLAAALDVDLRWLTLAA